jgi:hypothetical protein
MVFTKKFYPTFVFFAAIACILFACKKDKDNNGPSGRIFGNIQTFDDKLNSISDANGYQVVFEKEGGGSSTTAVADATGRYAVDDLPYGTYNLTFSKSGYGTYKMFGIVHQESPSLSTQIPNQSLGKFSTTTVTGLVVASNIIDGGPGVRFNYDISPAPSTSSRAFVRYFLSTNSSVSPTNYQKVSLLLSYSNTSNVTGFSKDSLTAMGFTAGQTVFARMYGDSFRSNDYTDPVTNKKVFPNVNLTTVPAVSFVVP